MKLLYITNGIKGSGGLERVLSMKASWFAERPDYEVCIVTLNEIDGEPFYEFSQSIIMRNVIALGGKLTQLFHYRNGIQQHINEFHPTIISVCDDGLKGLFIPLWLRCKGVPLVYERHASLSLNGSRMKSLFMSYCGCFYDIVIVLTKRNLTEWRGSNIQVIPNPLPSLNGESSTLVNKRILCVGSISFNKGYDLLINSWQLIAHKYPDWTIDIYGNGDSSSLQDMVRKSGLLGRLNFHPPTKAIEVKYQEASIFALPSRSEGFGMVLIEAMSFGLPCISFDCPSGPGDIITDGDNGFLVENGNVGQFADRLVALMDSIDLRRKIGAQAQKNAKQYDLKDIGKQWHQLFFALNTGRSLVKTDRA